MNLLDKSNIVLKKGIRNKVCPDCGGYFEKCDDTGFQCIECGYKLDKDGRSIRYFYGVIKMKDKTENHNWSRTINLPGYGTFKVPSYDDIDNAVEEFSDITSDIEDEMTRKIVSVLLANEQKFKEEKDE